MQSTEYLPYDIEVAAAERWMDRPIKVTLSTATPTGSTATTFYLNEAEAGDLIAKLANHPDGSAT